MEEVKYILEKNNIQWESPIIFVQNEDVITLSPLIIFARLEVLSVKQRNALINTIICYQYNKEKLIHFLNWIGNRLISIKI